MRTSPFYFASFLIALCLLDVAALGDIPDRVNYEKFQRIHQGQKQASDLTRGIAGTRLTEYRKKQDARRALESQKAKLTGTVAENRRALEAHKQAGAKSAAELSALKAKLVDIETAITRTTADIQKDTDLLQANESATAGQQSLVKNSEVTRSKVKTALAEEVKKLEALKAEAAKEVSNRDDLATRRSGILTDIAAASAELATFEREDERLTTQKTTLEARQQVLMTERGTKESAASAIESEREGYASGARALGEEIRSLRTRRDTLNAEVTVKDKKIAAGQTEAGDIGQQISQLGTRIEALQLRLESLARQRTDLRNKILSLELQSASDRRQLASLATQGGQLEKERQPIFETKASLEQRIRGQQARLDELATAVSDTDRALTLKKAELVAAVQELQRARSQITEARERTTLLSQRKSTLVLEVESLRKELAAQSETARSLEVKRQDLESQKKVIQQSVHRLGGEIGALETKITADAAALADYDAKITATETELKRAKGGERKRLEATIGQWRTDRSHLAIEWENLKRSRNEKRGELTGLEARLAALVLSSGEVEAKLVESKAIASALSAKFTAAEKEAGGLGSQIEKARSDLETAQSREASFDAKQVKLTFEATSLTNQRKDLAGMQSVVSSGLTASRNLLAETQSRLQTLDFKLSQLRAMIETTTRDLKEATESAKTHSSQLAAIPASIRETEGELTASLSAKTALEAKRTSITEAVAKAITERSTLMAKRDQVHALLAGRSEMLSAAERQLSQVGKRLSAVKAELLAVQKEIESTTLQLTDLGTRRSVVKAQRKQLSEVVIPGRKQALQKIEAALQTAEVKVTEARAKVSQAKTGVGSAETRLGLAEASYQTEIARLQTLQAQAVTLRGLRKTHSEKLTAEMNGRDQMRRDTQTKQQELTSVQSKIELLNRQILQAEVTLSALQTSITSALDVELISKGLYEVADQAAKTEETKTAAAWDKYQAVMAEYEKEKTATVVDGRNDGMSPGVHEGTERGGSDGAASGSEQGRIEGRTQGEREGRQHHYEVGALAGKARGEGEGRAKGSENGRDAGKRDGEQRGRELGLKKGYDIGYQEGFTLGETEGFPQGHTEAQLAKGAQEGATEGVVRARREAMAKEYFEGRRSAAIKARAAAPGVIVEIDNSVVADDEARSFGDAMTRPDRVASLSRVMAATGLSLPQTIALAVTAVQPPTIDLHNKVPVPDYRYRTYSRSYDHPDFLIAYHRAYDDAYRSAFEKEYPISFHANHRAAYQGQYESARKTASGESYPREEARGEAEGYRLAFERAYVTSRQAAYQKAFAKASGRAETEALPVRHDEGLTAGRAAGIASGISKGSAAAFREGRLAGAEKAYRESLDTERRLAFDKGETDWRHELADRDVVEVLEAKLVSSAGEERFHAGQAVSLQLTLRNYGAREVAAGKLSITVEDLRGTLSLPTKTAVLKRLQAAGPAGSLEAHYHNVLKGTVYSGRSENDLSLKVKVYRETTLIKEVTIAYGVEASLRAWSFTNPFLIGEAGQWWGGKLWIKNESTQSPSGPLEVKVTSRDPRIVVYPDWIPVSTVAPGEFGMTSFYVAVKKQGEDYSKNVFDVKIRNSRGTGIFSGGFRVPIYQR